MKTKIVSLARRRYFEECREELGRLLVAAAVQTTARQAGENIYRPPAWMLRLDAAFVRGRIRRLCTELDGARDPHLEILHTGSGPPGPRDWHDPLHLARVARRMNPRDGEASILLAMLLQWRERHAEAIPVLEQLRQRSRNPAQVARVLRNLAAAAECAGDVQAAARYSSSARNIWPVSVLSHMDPLAYAVSAEDPLLVAQAISIIDHGMPAGPGPQIARLYFGRRTGRIPEVLRQHVEIRNLIGNALRRWGTRLPAHACA